MKQNLKQIIIILFTNFTLAKFISALLTITILAFVKYTISGNFYIEYRDFFNNIGAGLLG
jgi:general stress protein CsbA